MVDKVLTCLLSQHMATGDGSRYVELLRQLSQDHKTQKEEGGGESDVNEELELLQNVYLDELAQIMRKEGNGVDLLFHVTPSTGGEIDKKYVNIDLHLSLPPEYPEEPAVVTIAASRGLSDTRLEKIMEDLNLKSQSLTGCPMVYELVELAKDSLTDHNLPCEECALCLHPFKEEDSFTKTECYHYFHLSCLARYLQFYERKRLEDLEEDARLDATLRQKPKPLDCPVCREVIAPAATCLEAVLQATPLLAEQQEDTQDIQISHKVRLWQKEMARLRQQQQEKGGQIDVNALDDVIDETWVRPTLSSSSQGEESGASVGDGPTASQHIKGTRHCRKSKWNSKEPAQKVTTDQGQRRERKNKQIQKRTTPDKRHHSTNIKH